MLYIKRLHRDLDSMPLPRKTLWRRSKSRIEHTRASRKRIRRDQSRPRGACIDCDLDHCRSSAIRRAPWTLQGAPFSESLRKASIRSCGYLSGGSFRLPAAPSARANHARRSSELPRYAPRSRARCREGALLGGLVEAGHPLSAFRAVPTGCRAVVVVKSPGDHIHRDRREPALRPLAALSIGFPSVSAVSGIAWKQRLFGQSRSIVRPRSRWTVSSEKAR